MRSAFLADVVKIQKCPKNEDTNGRTFFLNPPGKFYYVVEAEAEK